MVLSVEEFSFSKWYHLFERDTIESIVLPIPDDVMEYLRTGSLILPQEALPTKKHKLSSEEHYTVDWSDGGDAPEVEIPTFPSFSCKIKDAVNTLGGQVFIKMNWHAPKDAVWITTGRTLKCTSLEDIYLLLKSSDILSQDISYEFKISSGLSPSIVIKRWVDMHPGCEFRCFVYDHHLLAISQRDYRSYYGHINANKYDILKELTSFFQRVVKGKFPLPAYVLDVARLGYNNIVIVDFQPFDKTYSDSLLFSWEELIKMSKLESSEQSASSYNADIAICDPEFRFLGEDPGLQPNPCQHDGMPYEIKELCTELGGVSLVDYLLKEVREQHSSES